MELCDHRRWRFCVVAACLNLLGIVLLVPFAGAEEQASGEAAPMVSTGHPQETVKVVPTVNVATPTLSKRSCSLQMGAGWCVDASIDLKAS
jgi:hypothetical protein